MTPAMAARPRLAPEDLEALYKLGVTPEQTQAVNRRLPSIARALEPATPMRDVRDILQAVDQHVGALAKVLGLAEGGQLPAHRAALAQLQLAAGLAEGEPLDRSGLGLLPKSPDFPAIVRLLRQVASHALANVPATQARGRRDPAQAVAHLLSALSEPNDKESAPLARRAAKPSALPSKANPFAEIAEIVFKAATGAASVDPRAALDAWRKRRQVWRQPTP